LSNRILFTGKDPIGLKVVLEMTDLGGALSRRFGLAASPGGSVAKGMKKISYKGYRFPAEIIQQIP
jgi:hypothetical protein